VNDLERTLRSPEGSERLGRLMLDEVPLTVERFWLEDGRMFVQATTTELDRIKHLGGRHSFQLFAPDGTLVFVGESDFPSWKQVIEDSYYPEITITNYTVHLPIQFESATVGKGWAKPS
jgi:hypothetical protein